MAICIITHSAHGHRFRLASTNHSQCIIVLWTETQGAEVRLGINYKCNGCELAVYMYAYIRVGYSYMTPYFAQCCRVVLLCVEFIFIRTSVIFFIFYMDYPTNLLRECSPSARLLSTKSGYRLEKGILILKTHHNNDKKTQTFFIIRLIIHGIIVSQRWIVTSLKKTANIVEIVMIPLMCCTVTDRTLNNQSDD